MGKNCESGQWLVEAIKQYVLTAPENNLGLPSGERAFDEPLIGFSSGADPLYDEYKNHIGPFYFTPLELFTKTFPEQNTTKEDLTIISWIIPSTKATRLEQSSQTKYPSERWTRTRAMGEDFNNTLRREVLRILQTADIPSLAPLLSDNWQRSDQGPYAPCSNWSERHAAYAAGLGAFGLCDGLITPVGKAIRAGSVIAQTQFPPSHKPYTDHHANCLHYTHNSCRKCIERCPVNALSPAGHDKKRCMQYVEHTMNKYVLQKYEIDTYACGLCQCGVPCMDHIPTPEEG